MYIIIYVYNIMQYNIQNPSMIVRACYFCARNSPPLCISKLNNLGFFIINMFTQNNAHKQCSKQCSISKQP